MLPFLILAVAVVAAGCKPPVLISMDTARGPERTLVMVQGNNLIFSSVIWDAGLPTERAIPGGFLGGYMFSVPPGVAQGAHPVALSNSYGRSVKLNFDVTAPQPFGAPRIDAITIFGANIDRAGHVGGWLYVQGANFDVGAIVQIAGSDVASVAHKGLRNDLYGIAPTALGYPIYHFVSVFGIMGTRTAGSTLKITVKNLDGQISQPLAYQLPSSLATLDSDGDSLLDSWERNGYDANGDGVIDVNLQGLGADPYRRDLFLEVDVMTGLANPPVATSGTTPGTFDTAQAVFAAAPILNPTTDNGVHLVIDSSGTVTHSQTVGFTAADNAALSSANYSTLKARNFDNATRDEIYHYAIWADAQPGGWSGISDVDFTAGCGDDFLVTFDDFPVSYQTMRSQVETLVHEFGHSLGQRHGGEDHSAYKPNHWGIMAYTWQLRTGRANAWRVDRPTCTAMYYQTAGAVETNGALPAAFNAFADYSDGMAATLVENTNSLREPDGVSGTPIDWNGDGDSTDVNINADVDHSGSSADTVRDFANWRALNYKGPHSDGTVTP